MGRILTRSTRIAQPGALVGIADDFLRYKPRVVVDFARSRAICANTAAPLEIDGTRVATPYGMGVHSFSGGASTPVGELCHPPQTQIALVYIRAAVPGGTYDVAGFSGSGDSAKFTVSPYQWTWALQRNYVGPQIVVSGSGMPCQPAAGRAYILVSRSVSDTDHAFRVIRLDNGASEVGTATTNTSAVSFVDPMPFKAGVGGYTVPLLWAMFDEYIPDAVLDTITANPWAMLAPARRPLYFDVGAGGGGGVTGTAAISQDGNTVAATATLALAGSLSASQSANTLSATGQLAIQATASTAQDAHTLAATGAGSTPNTGLLSATQGANAVAATAQLAIVGAGSAAQDANTLAGTGTLPLQASATISQDAHTLLATGTGAAGNTGTAVITQADHAVAATGIIVIAGSANIQQGAHSLDAIGTVPIIGTLAAQLDGHTVSATGTVYSASFTDAQLREILIYIQENLVVPTAGDIATAILAAAAVTPIKADVQLMNSAEVVGTGTTGDAWRGVGVSP